MNRKKSIILVVIMAVIIIVPMTYNIIMPPKEMSISERRHLTKMPKLTVETVLNGKYMSEFEKYASDQFILREQFRKVYAFAEKYIFMKRDVNDIYVVDGYAAKLEPELNEESVDYAVKKINYICDTYLKNNKAYFTIVPDKNYYLAKDNGYPYIDYGDFKNRFDSGLSEMITTVDITDELSEECYYHTDSHWRQDKILNVADKLLETLTGGKTGDYKTLTIDNDFYGVFASQSALTLKPDTINYLVNDNQANYVIKCYDEAIAEDIPLYSMELAYGKDPYEMFLSGAKALITIENPAARTDKKLIMFRDSFGSSLAPLLAEEYKEIVLVDIRYLQPQFLGKHIDFESADVLFIYSVSVLNASKTQFLQ